MSSEKREASPEASPLKGPAPKAVPEDTSDVAFEDGIPLSPMAGGGDQNVQFISGAPANGDAKVEIGDSGGAPTFVGLGKEELMKYANDPFWVRLRWILFFLFWLLWIAMLVGAIVIIVLAPRCAEKKAIKETFYQMKGHDLIKDGAFEQHVKAVADLGVGTIIVTDLLQHDPDTEPEAVTDFNKIDSSVEAGLFKNALEELKKQGIRVLMQIVPNHSGTKHEWFSNPENDFYVRKPYDEVKKSPWTTQDKVQNAWTPDSRNTSVAYLHQFSGPLADLNFRNDEVLDKMKATFDFWKESKMDGFVISKASFLVENLDDLMSQKSTKNQPDNVHVIAKLVGTNSLSSTLVELDEPSDETIKEYTKKGMTPVLRSVDTSNAESVRKVLQTVEEHPDVVMNLAKSAASPAKVDLVKLLAAGSGYHALVAHENIGSSKDYLKNVIKFQQEFPRGKQASVEYSTEGSNLLSALRTDGDDEYFILANFGQSPATFKVDTFNKTESAHGVVKLATSNALQKITDMTHGDIPLGGLSGLVVKLEAHGTTS